MVQKIEICITNVTNGMKVVIEPRVTIFYHMERNLESDQNMLLHMV